MSVQTQIPILDLKPQVEALWPELTAALEKVLKSTSFILGPEEQTLEKELAAKLGVKHAIGCNSGTDALYIALRALEIGPGDEVITSSFTFFATAESISHVGATPVFVDIEAGSMNLDLAKIEAAITPRTKAIIPVHLFGRPVDLDGLMAIAKKHGLKVVEDCAQSFGADWKGTQTGITGEIGCFSFFPTKNLGAYGDAGLMTTNDDALADTMRMLRVHGSRRRYYNECVGYNSRLDEMQAAILRVKLPHIDSWNQARRAVAQRYNDLFKGQDRIVTPEVVPGHVFHQYTLRVIGVDRDALQAKLAEQGIGAMIYYPVPCHKLKLYEESHKDVVLPVTEQLATEVISLPIWPELTAEKQAVVAQALIEALPSVAR
ncbi:MAG TPA: DegT/DnrJ/EryC1/StrS family aminotransferase [Holophagaceae bacterium]|nr:DegT/DnrJ/EryC1/StrS family aminotransferase [Holophagaceae bacterium]